MCDCNKSLDTANAASTEQLTAYHSNLLDHADMQWQLAGALPQI